MDTIMLPLRERLYSLLRRSERYTKTDMVYLAHGGFWLSVGTAVTAFSSFVLSIAFANLLPLAAYGTYKYVVSVAGIVNAFTLTGLSTAVVEAVSRGKEAVLKQAFWTNLVWSAPSSIVAVGVAAYYALQGNAVLAASLVLIAVVQPLTVSVAFGESFLIGKKAFRATAAYYAVDNFVPALALIGVMFVSKNALAIVATYFVANLVTTAGVYWYVKRRFKPNSATDDKAIGYGKHLSAMNVFSNLADNFDKVLTFHFLGPAQLALYSFALALPSQAKLITKPLGNLVFPKFAAREEDELRGAMGEKVLRFFILGLVMTVGYLVVAPTFFKLFYPHYLDAVPLSQIYALSLLGIGLSPMGTFLSAKRKVKAQYIMGIITNSFQLVSAVVGMVLGGILGLIISRVATRILGGVLGAVFYYFDI